MTFSVPEHSDNGFRLSLQSGVPVPLTDQVAKTTLYLTPCTGNAITLYTGAYWKTFKSAEVSLSLGTLTSGKNYDVFAYGSGTSVVLELSVAWTNDMTRADAITMQDGTFVKSSAATRRLVGTIRTTSTTTTEDSVANRYVINLYNQTPVEAQYTSPNNLSSHCTAGMSASYVTVTSGSGFANARVLSASTGITITDSGAGSNISIGIKNNVVATLTGSTFSGPVIASGSSNGFTGSLTQVSSGVPYILCQGVIKATTSSLGQIILSSSGGIAGSSYNTVYNGSGTPMTQRNGIKFAGACSVSDNGTQTVVTTTDGYDTVYNSAGAAQTQRSGIKFAGALPSVADAGGQTVVTINGYNTVYNGAGAAQTQRTGLQVIGASSVADNGSNTVITLQGGSTFGLYSGRPAASYAGNTYIASGTCNALWVDNGSSWQPVINGNVVAVQPPLASAFASLHAMSFDDRSGTLRLFGVDDYPSPYIRGADIGYSSSTALVEGCLKGLIPTWNIGAGAYAAYGIHMRESSTTKVYTVGYRYDYSTRAASLMTAIWSDYAGLIGSVVRPLAIENGPTFLRIRRVSTYVYAEVSCDLNDWFVVETINLTDAFTTAPDRVGAYAQGYGAVPYAYLKHFRYGSA